MTNETLKGRTSKDIEKDLLVQAREIQPRGLSVPFVAQIPVEVENKINKQINLEQIYFNDTNKRIEKEYSKLNSNLRKLGSYLFDRHGQEVSLDTAAVDLGINSSTVRALVSALNFYQKYPITHIPVPKKAGFVQSALKDLGDYERWDRKKMKTLTFMSQVKSKAEEITTAKRTAQKVQEAKDSE